MTPWTLISKLYFHNVILIQVMEPFSDWKPPEPPNELLDTTSYKIFDELWKLGSNTARILTEDERRFRIKTKIKAPVFRSPDIPGTVVEMVRSEKSGE